MKYKVKITETDTPLAVGVLTDRGRIVDDMRKAGWSSPFIVGKDRDCLPAFRLEPIAIELQEISQRIEPDQNDAKYIVEEKYSITKYADDLKIYNDYIDSLNTFPCSAELEDFIIENKLTELERNVDFFIVLSSDYPDDELLKGKFVADTKNPDRTMEMEMTVNGFIKHLQGLNPELRAKKIVITAPNGLQFEPVIKQQLIDKYNVFGGVENVECMVITYD
jgi:hypothetical protein